MRIFLTADPELPVPPKLYGGIERIVDQLIIELREAGHQIGLAAHRESETEVENFYPWPGSTSRNLGDTIANMFALKSAIADFRPDVLHSFSRLMYMLPIFASRIPKVMSYQRLPSKRQVKWSSKIFGAHLQFTGCSDYICKVGRKAGGQWTTIHNFVPLERFTFQPAVAQDAPLVFLSRIERIKGAHLAISIARACGRRLLIAGNYSTSGPEGQYWREEVLPKINNHDVEYVGVVNDHEKNKLLGTAAAIIVPIQWEEPFGIVFAESLACGTPVISCRRGALPEIVRTGVDGFLVNTIEEGCEAVSRIHTLNRFDCRQRAESLFSSSTICSRYQALYADLASK